MSRSGSVPPRDKEYQSPVVDAKPVTAKEKKVKQDKKDKEDEDEKQVERLAGSFMSIISTALEIKGELKSRIW